MGGFWESFGAGVVGDVLEGGGGGVGEGGEVGGYGVFVVRCRG